MENAVNSFESFLKLHPNDSKAIFQLAECYHKLKNYRHVEDNYRQANRNLNHMCDKQSLAISHYKLGLMQLKINNYEQAKKSFNDAIDLDQELNSQRFAIGVFHEYYKQWEHALEAYESRLLQDKNAE